MAIDLVILTADKRMRLTLKGLLERPQSLAIRSIQADIRSHPRLDGGVLREGHVFLRELHTPESHALAVFDRDGCGSRRSREKLEEEVEARLEQSGWEKDRCAAIVIDPELEAWFWSDSPHVEKALGWVKGRSKLEEWLVRKGFLHEGQRKPAKPKEAVEEALRYCKTPLSPSIYYDLVARVSFERCTDPAFLKLRSLLKQWFPQKSSMGGPDP
jgi:hypothetical protein